MSRVFCMGVLCPDKEKYHTLIYTITCEVCYRRKMKLMDVHCECTIAKLCDYCYHRGMEDEDDD